MHPLAFLIAVALAFPSATTQTATSAPVSTHTATTVVPPLSTTSTGTGTSATVAEAPVPVVASNIPPAGRRLSANQVLAIARALPRMKAVRAEYPGSYDGAYLKGPSRWQVSFFSKNGAKEIGQVIIADATGKVLEQWTGFQVAWSMARGYPGAFGRHVNALYIWLPLCVLFVLPFIDPRRPFALLHLDLLVLLCFSVSLAFFNHAHINASVPLSYPPLAYLLVRMLMSLRRGRPPQRPLKLLVPVPWLALGVLFLLGFRVALNATDANVIDVGYAGVIGAQKVVRGEALYGGWPQDNEHGDTYGPVSYESYVPFEQLAGWSGKWDDLPAAHVAAVVFDLLALGLVFLLGMRIRGPTLAVALAYAWVSYPFTLYALESNSNDTLVAVFVLAALLVAGSPPVRPLRKAGSGALAALAGLTKFAPLALAPVLAAHGLPRGGRARALTAFLGAFALTAAIVSIPALSHDSLRTIYKRTIEYQANRGSPFSVWGLYGWHGAETVVQALAVVLAVALAFLPRRGDLVGLAAACAAILIAAQLGIEHWFYLYIPWFFGLVMIALLGARPEWVPRSVYLGGSAEGRITQAPPSGPGAPVPAPTPIPVPPLPDGASEPARLRLPSAEWGRSG